MELPNIVWELVFFHLPLPGLASMMRTSKNLKSAIENNDILWQKMHNEKKVNVLFIIDHVHCHEDKHLKLYPQISQFNPRLRFLNEWKAVEACFLENWKDAYVDGKMRRRSGPKLPFLPPSVSIGIYDFCNMRVPRISYYANADFSETEIKDDQLDPTLVDWDCKVHTVWGQNVTVNFMEPPFGCESYYTGPEPWQKWYNSDGYIIVIPLPREEGKAMWLTTEEKVTKLFEELVNSNVVDIGDNPHVVKKKITSVDIRDCWYPMVLVGSYPISPVPYESHTYSVGLQQLAEKYNIPYVEISDYTIQDSLHVIQMLLFEMAKYHDWTKRQSNQGGHQKKDKCTVC